LSVCFEFHLKTFLVPDALAQPRRSWSDWLCRVMGL